MALQDISYCIRILLEERVVAQYVMVSWKGKIYKYVYTLKFKNI